MKGAYELTVQNKRIHYQFTIKRNITVIRGDSATGKTTLLEMIETYSQNGISSGIDFTKPQNINTARPAPNPR